MGTLIIGKNKSWEKSILWESCIGKKAWGKTTFGKNSVGKNVLGKVMGNREKMLSDQIRTTVSYSGIVAAGPKSAIAPAMKLDRQLRCHGCISFSPSAVVTKILRPTSETLYSCLYVLSFEYLEISRSSFPFMWHHALTTHPFTELLYPFHCDALSSRGTEPSDLNEIIPNLNQTFLARLNPSHFLWLLSLMWLFIAIQTLCAHC